MRLFGDQDEFDATLNWITRTPPTLPAPREVEAFGLRYKRPKAQYEEDAIFDLDGSCSKFMQDWFHLGSRRKLNQIHNRLTDQELLAERLMLAIGARFQEIVDAALSNRIVPIEQRMDATASDHEAMRADLHATLTTVHDTVKSVMERFDALQEKLTIEIQRIDDALGALPASWRRDFEQTIEALQRTTTAANALLNGAETLAQAVARDLDEMA